MDDSTFFMLVCRGEQGVIRDRYGTYNEAVRAAEHKMGLAPGASYYITQAIAVVTGKVELDIKTLVERG